MTEREVLNAVRPGAVVLIPLRPAQNERPSGPRSLLDPCPGEGVSRRIFPL